MANKNPIRHNTFKKAPQGLDDKKSQGQIERARNINLIKSARTLFDNADILPDLIDNVKDQVQNGQNRDALELLKIIKEPEDKNINIKGGIETQKVFITEEQKKEALKHIEDVINDR